MLDFSYFPVVGGQLLAVLDGKMDNNLHSVRPDNDGVLNDQGANSPIRKTMMKVQNMICSGGWESVLTFMFVCR